MNTKFKSLGPLPVTKEQHERFKAGELWQQWSESYPLIFDETDKERARKHAPRGYYFYEWLAAVVMYETTGYLSLVDHYQYHQGSRKNGLFRQFVGVKVADEALRIQRYYPDLLVYKPDLSDWYFVEAKGPKDSLQLDQAGSFDKVLQLTGKPIYLMQFVLFKE
ncbi:MAG: hypothetical protein L0322_15445 [Chloroflexi bacterium]|nr:hypothetical protein [Chloroflexota bacterium]MCI0649035.1 hypothetical protein [Chloroflexota bacterium]